MCTHRVVVPFCQHILRAIVLLVHLDDAVDDGHVMALVLEEHDLAHLICVYTCMCVCVCGV